MYLDVAGIIHEKTSKDYVAIGNEKKRTILLFTSLNIQNQILKRRNVSSIAVLMTWL